MNDLSVRIKGIRLKKGLSQEEVAEKLGMNQSNYARLENGKTDIKFERLAQIAKALEMSVGTLLDYDEKAELTEDARFYFDSLQEKIKEIEKLKEHIAELEEDTILLEKIEKLEEKIKELTKEVKEKKEEIIRVSNEKERLITEKDKRIEAMEITIQTLQKVVNKLSS